MSQPKTTFQRLPMVLAGLGCLTLGAGVVLQSQGVAVPPLLGSDTTFGVMAKLGGILVIGALLIIAATQIFAADGSTAKAAPRLKATRIPASGDPFDRLARDGSVVPTAAAPMTDAAPDSTAPTLVGAESMAGWQRRLAEKAAAAAPVIEAPPRSLRRSLHRTLLAVVAMCFVALLGLVIWTQINTSLNAPPPEVTMTPAELIAAAAADYLIEDAPKDRHWTEIDLTGIVEWFVARGLLAMTGDTSAMIEIGSMVGGLMFLMFGLRVFFVLRLANARRHRPRDITTMGYR